MAPRALLLCLAATLAVSAATDTIEVHGAGTTNPSKFFWKVIERLEERARVPLLISYRAVGSSTGMKEMMGAAPQFTPFNHFGAGDIPMTADRYATIEEHARKTVHIPFAVGGIAIFHNVPGADRAGMTKPLHLNACLLARVFSRDIKHWDHADILEENAGFAPPADCGTKGTCEIKVVHRKKGSSSTAGTTEYLKTACAASWTLEAGGTINWPADTVEAEGSGGVAAAIKATPYAVGYLDAGHGHSEGFAEIALKNAHGVYLTSDAADIGAAATTDNFFDLPADVVGTDWSAFNLYNKGGATTWPITMMSHFYVDKDISAMNVDSAALMKAFIDYVLSDEGQALAEEFSFVKIPTKVKNYNAAALEAMVLPSGLDSSKEFTFETSTNVGGGAGERVLSVKRRTYGEVQRDSLQTQVTAQAALIAAQAQAITALEAKLDAQFAGIKAACKADNRDRRLDPCSVAQEVKDTVTEDILPASAGSALGASSGLAVAALFASTICAQ